MQVAIGKTLANIAAELVKTDLRVRQLEDKIMSKITDFAATTQANFTAIQTSLDGITAGIANLDALITQLQNSPGTLSPADQAALDAIQQASADLVTKAQAISTAPPASGTTTA